MNKNKKGKDNTKNGKNFQCPTLTPRISTPIPRIRTLIPYIPAIPNLIPHVSIIPILIPRIPILIPRIPLPNSPFRLLQIAIKNLKRI